MNILAAGPFDGAIAGPAGIPVAFLVGMISFFTPCILPLVPGYLSYMSGVSGEDLAAGAQRKRVLIATGLFVLGFAVIFTALGATASAFGGLLLDHLVGLQRVAGAIVIVMGLAFLLTLRIESMVRVSQEPDGWRQIAVRPLLFIARIFTTERGIHAKPRAGLIGAFPLGAAFAVGWTPCVGPGLATILTLAGTEGSVLRGAALLFAFSLGFGVWFVLGGLAFEKAMSAFGAVKRHLGALTLVSGLFLVAIGILLVTNQWGTLMAPLRRLINRFSVPV